MSDEIVKNNTQDKHTLYIDLSTLYSTLILVKQDNELVKSTKVYNYSSNPKNKGELTVDSYDLSFPDLIARLNEAVIEIAKDYEIEEVIVSIISFDNLFKYSEPVSRTTLFKDVESAIDLFAVEMSISQPFISNKNFFYPVLAYVNRVEELVLDLTSNRYLTQNIKVKLTTKMLLMLSVARKLKDKDAVIINVDDGVRVVKIKDGSIDNFRFFYSLSDKRFVFNMHDNGVSKEDINQYIKAGTLESNAITQAYIKEQIKEVKDFIGNSNIYVLNPSKSQYIIKAIGKTFTPLTSKMMYDDTDVKELIDLGWREADTVSKERYLKTVDLFTVTGAIDELDLSKTPADIVINNIENMLRKQDKSNQIQSIDLKREFTGDLSQEIDSTTGTPSHKQKDKNKNKKKDKGKKSVEEAKGRLKNIATANTHKLLEDLERPQEYTPVLTNDIATSKIKEDNLVFDNYIHSTPNIQEIDLSPISISANSDPSSEIDKLLQRVVITEVPLEMELEKLKVLRATVIDKIEEKELEINKETSELENLSNKLSEIKANKEEIRKQEKQKEIDYINSLKSYNTEIDNKIKKLINKSAIKSEEDKAIRDRILSTAIADQDSSMLADYHGFEDDLSIMTPLMDEQDDKVIAINKKIRDKMFSILNLKESPMPLVATFIMMLILLLIPFKFLVDEGVIQSSYAYVIGGVNEREANISYDTKIRVEKVVKNYTKKINKKSPEDKQEKPNLNISLSNDTSYMIIVVSNIKYSSTVADLVKGIEECLERLKEENDNSIDFRFNDVKDVGPQGYPSFTFSYTLQLK